MAVAIRVMGMTVLGGDEKQAHQGTGRGMWVTRVRFTGTGKPQDLT